MNTDKIHYLADKIIGVHYHVGIRINENGDLVTDSAFGRFIEEIVQLVKEVRLFLHEGSPDDMLLLYNLSAEKIRWISLGKKGIWELRLLKWRSQRSQIQNEISKCDALIVRGDTPLGPFFLENQNVSKGVYIIQNYYHASKQLPVSIKGIRSKILAIDHDIRLKNKLKIFPVAVLSSYLFKLYNQKGISDVEIIPSSTYHKDETYRISDRMQKLPINILYAGRIEVGKGIFTILEAFRFLKQETNIEFRLDFVGSMQLNRLKEKFFLEVEKDSTINYHGSFPIGKNLWEYYKNADVFLLPSVHEAMGRVVLEAMTHSVPVIASNVGGIPQHVIHEKTGLLIDPDSPIQIKEAILRLINDISLRKLIIKNAYSHALEFTVENQTKKLIDFFASRWGWNNSC